IENESKWIWISKSTYFRFQWENDAFQVRGNNVTDRFFTNGFRLDFLNNISSKLPTKYLLLRFGKYSQNLYGFSIGQEMYTPTNIEIDTILRNDRPYAGWLYLASNLISNDPYNQQRLTTEFLLGVIGEWSFASELQRTVHRWINSPEPRGWRNQIANDIGINYFIKYEKRLIRQVHERLDIIQSIEGQAGTVTNFIGLGTQIRVGLFNDYFRNITGVCEKTIEAEVIRSLSDDKEHLFDESHLSPEEKHNLEQWSDPQAFQDSIKQKVYELVQNKSHKKFQFYFFINPNFRAVLDNSFLQGGVFGNQNSPHTISADKIRRFYVNVEYGAVIGFRGFQLSFSQLFRTKEFEGAENQQWGKIALIVGFNH
ncbi:MAG: lipid A deacylase LpxR family protein, partial [Bacteroidota bacterium]